MNAELSRIFLTRTTAEWAKLLDEADVPSAPMHTLDSMMQDPHMLATDFFQQVEHPTEGAVRNMKVAATWSKTPVDLSRLASHLGEQNAEVLAEVGYTAEQIEKLHRDGVLKQAAIPDTSEL